MVPVEKYCSLCGGFLEMTFTDGRVAPLGQHDHLEDCVETLVNRIQELEANQHA